MDLIQLAVPFFILAMALEFLYGRVRGKQSYRLNDTVNSLSVGVISTIMDLLRLGFATVVFAAVAKWMGVSPWSMDSAWQWVAAFVAYDFCYYWKHRFGHEWRIMWASHVAHHQSEEYNLSTALRQTGTDYIGFVFYLPLYVAGLPAAAVLTVGSLNLIYQFWVHTKHVDKLGSLEWLLITPSNHRVHHARNPEYLDKNYGGVFILWDRLFRTYQEELPDRPCVYGITTGLHSWNPLWANFHVWLETAQLAWRTRSWRDKLTIWFRSPGWVPADLEQPKSPDWQAPKFDPAVDGWTKGYVFLQFWIVTLVSIWTLAVQNELARPIVIALFVWMVCSLWIIGAFLEGRPFARKAESLRLASCLMAAGVLAVAFPAEYAVASVVIATYAGVSVLALLLRRNPATGPSPEVIG
ncbi:sterol desaturase family protein [Proteobacteria bacterium 005FR1]|nr:sterol desaturase family protein [Proteobacteria bacterium 005FR1]